MNSKLKNVFTILGIYSGSIFLAIVLAPLGGLIHRSFWESQGCWFWGPCDKGAQTEGFIYFYIFLLVIFSFSFLKQKTAWIVFIIGTILFWAISILMVITEDWMVARKEYIGSLMIMLVSFAIGYIIALGTRKLMKR